MRKVVCSWGRKGLSMAEALASRMARVSSTAVFTLCENLATRGRRRRERRRSRKSSREGEEE